MPRKPFNLERLFEPRTPPTGPYPTFEAELDAIREGKKHVSIFCPMLEDLVEPGSQYFEILNAAFQRGLVVIVHAFQELLPNVHPEVFVTRPDQVWRVPALRAVSEALSTRGVADRDRRDERSLLALELQQSVLLGYTAAQCKAFVERLRQREDGLYVLLTAEQKARVLPWTSMLGRTR